MIINNSLNYTDMEAEKTYQNKVPRTIQQKRGGEGALEFVDNRQGGILQAVAEPVQRLEDEDKTLQGKFEQPVQRLGDEEDETLQGKFAQTVQREEDDDEALQGKFEQPVQKKNETGMPDNLKAGIEDRTLLLPRDAGILSDFRSLRVVKGVARVPEQRARDRPGAGMRHGDSAVAAAMMLDARKELGSSEPWEYEGISMSDFDFKKW